MNKVTHVWFTLCDNPRFLGGRITHLCTQTPTVETLGGRLLPGSRRTESKVVLPRP